MAKTLPAKVAPKKVQPAPKVVEDTARENRYSRSAKVIIGNLSIDAAALSTQAELSMSTARHCLDAWSAITAVLKQNGALTPAFVKQLSGKPSDTTPVASAK